MYRTITNHLQLGRESYLKVIDNLVEGYSSKASKHRDLHQLNIAYNHACEAMKSKLNQIPKEVRKLLYFYPTLNIVEKEFEDMYCEMPNYVFLWKKHHSQQYGMFKDEVQLIELIAQLRVDVKDKEVA